MIARQRARRQDGSWAKEAIKPRVGQLTAAYHLKSNDKKGKGVNSTSVLALRRWEHEEQLELVKARRELFTVSVKLPLKVRKSMRDTAKQEVDICAKASSIVGSPVTLTYDLDALYAALAPNREHQLNVVRTCLAYFTETVTALARCYTNPGVKAEVNAAWTTKNFSFAIVTEAELERMRDDLATTGSTTSHHWRLRIDQGGDLQMVSDVRHWGLNVLEVQRTDLTPLGNASRALRSGSDALPVEVKLQEAQPLVTAQLTRIRALKGLEDAAFDLDGHTVATYAVTTAYDVGWQHFSPTTFAEYLDGLATLLEELWKDDLSSEALLDVWTTPHTIRVEAEVDVEAATGTVVRNPYHGIKVDGPTLAILVAVSRWRINMAQISRLDLTSVL
jgi:hypothetical protein